MALLPVECADCGAHYQLDPAGDIQGSVCDQCGGGKFFYMDQPSPTQSDGTVRDMVDSDSQMDQGGNPLGEGTIMGRDGERPAGQRDNFMHSKVGSPEKFASSPQANYVNHYAGEVAFCPECGLPDNEGVHNTHMCANCGHWFMHDEGLREGQPPAYQHPDPMMDNEPGTVTFPQNWIHSAIERVEAMRPPTLNMEPYPTLWSDEHVAGTKEAFGVGNLLNMLPGAAETAAGAVGDAIPGLDFGPAEALTADGVANMAEEAGGSAVKDLAAQGGKKLLGMGASHLMQGALKAGENAIGMGGAQAGGMAPQAVTPAPNIMQFGSVQDIPAVLAALETSDSVKSVDDHDDPEQQDQKEFNDGDKSPSNLKNPNNEDSGQNGEDATRSDSPEMTGFSEDSPGIERMEMVLPLLLHYFQSEESGQNDPIIRGIHEALEAENPGYLSQKHPNGEHAVQMIIQQHKQPPKHAGVNMSPATAMPSGLPSVPTPGTDLPANNPTNATGGTCPLCGGALAADGSCPQCGFKQHPQGGPSQVAAPGGGGHSVPGQSQPFVGSRQASIFDEIASLRQSLPQNVQHQIDQMLRYEGPNAVMRFLQTMTPQAPTSQGSPMWDSMVGDMAPAYAKTATSGPGPQTAEQKAAVIQLLQQQGRDGDIPFVETEPWRFAEELAQIQGNPNTAPLVDPSQQPTPPPAMMGAPGGMPVQDPSQPAGGMAQPMQPMAHTADANTRVKRCPQCGSGSTRVQTEGDPANEDAIEQAYCPSCGHIFKIAKQVYFAEVVNPALEDAATRTDVSPEGIQDPSRVWTDDQGNELVVGQTYDLYTAGVPEPDVVKVLSAKPDQVNLKLVGEFSNVQPDAVDDQRPDFRITSQQMHEGRYTFTPSDDQSSTQGAPEGGMPGMDQIPQSPPTTDEVSSQYPNGGASISAAVVASDDYDMDDPEICHKCGNDRIYHTASSPTRTMHECDRCQTAWETEDSDYGERTAASDLGWLYNDSHDDNFFAEMEQAQRTYGGGSRDISSIASNDKRLAQIRERLDANRMSREAGRHFTPMEQKGLVNESGRARNSDKLDLSGTHYEAASLAQVMGYDPRDPKNRANGENAPDAHVIFGL